MPIAILEIPKGTSIDIWKAKELCGKAGDSLHDILSVPDPEDKEIRIIRNSLGGTTLRIAFTIGPNEYPKFEPKSFFPTKEQIESAGESVLEIIKDSQIGVSQVVFEAWRDTTFVLREGEASEPISPVSEEVLREIGSHLVNPRIRLVLSPQKREGASSLKELGSFPENKSYQEVASKLSSRLTEILGRKEAITAEVEFADFAETDFSVEFDCETDPNNSISQEVREYLTKSVLSILDSSRSTKEGFGEVWIRQGQPERIVFER